MIQHIFILLLAFPLLLSLGQCTAQPSPATATQTAITQPDTAAAQELRQYHTLIEMLYDLRLNHTHRARLRPFVDGYRLSNVPAKRKVMDNCLALYQQITAMPPVERLAYCRNILPVGLMEQWKLAKTGDAEAKLMLELYYEAHPPIAQGTPHLTRDMVDALLEFDHFFNTEVKGLKTGPIVQPSAKKCIRRP
jgi:hypothetical protein